jgi:hypothetical protein
MVLLELGLPVQSRSFQGSRTAVFLVWLLTTSSFGVCGVCTQVFTLENTANAMVKAKFDTIDDREGGCYQRQRPATLGRSQDGLRSST